MYKISAAANHFFKCFYLKLKSQLNLISAKGNYFFNLLIQKLFNKE